MHETFMREALKQARESGSDVPVGAVIVYQGEIIARAHNERETGDYPFAHAEMLCMQRACEKLHTRRLRDCTLYVTLEPCPMCAGAILNARIPRVVYGAEDAKNGACGSVCDLFSMEFNHHPKVEKGVKEEACAALLTEFFQQLRVTLRDRPKWRKSE